MKKLVSVLIVLAVISAVFALPPYAASDKYLGADAHGKRGGTLVLGTLSGPKTLNDIVAQETSSTQIIARFMATMVERDNHGLWYPALAENWKIEVTPEGRMILYWYLRKGVKWSDGQPFTADDVVYTINNIYFNKDIPNDFQNLFPEDNWPKAYKVDDYTVKVEFNRPYRLAWRYIGGTYIWPKHVIEKYLAEGKEFKEIWGVDSINNHEIVGLGPFIPVEYKEAEYVRLVRNPYYWKKDADGVLRSPLW
jgi:peptide/nickel transport system substrate-binding protein